MCVDAWMSRDRFNVIFLVEGNPVSAAGHETEEELHVCIITEMSNIC